MTKLLEQLVAAASQLPPEEQDVLARHWLADVRGGNIGEALRDELDFRLEEHRRRPDDVLSWQQVQSRIQARLER